MRRFWRLAVLTAALSMGCSASTMSQDTAGTDGGSGPDLADGSLDPGCVPRTCTAGVNCGNMPDGCSGTIDCGNDCAAGQMCGGAVANVCGDPVAGIVPAERRTLWNPGLNAVGG